MLHHPPSCPSPPGAEASAARAGLRFHEVQDDHLAPTLRQRDFVLLNPVSHYCGEGIYVLRDGIGGTLVYRCNASLKPGKTRIRLYCENPLFADRFMSPEEFAEDVVGKVAMTCKVLDYRLNLPHPFAA